MKCSLHDWRQWKITFAATGVNWVLLIKINLLTMLLSFVSVDACLPFLSFYFVCSARRKHQTCLSLQWNFRAVSMNWDKLNAGFTMHDLHHTFSFLNSPHMETNFKPPSSQCFNYSPHANDATQICAQWLEGNNGKQKEAVPPRNAIHSIVFPFPRLPSTCVSHSFGLHPSPFFVPQYSV